MEDINQQSVSPSPQQPLEIKKKASVSPILYIVLGVLLAAGSFYAGLSYPKVNKVQNLPASSSVPNPKEQQNLASNPSPSSQPTITWRKYGTDSVYSFDYPNGWHIYSGWYGENGEPLGIQIDPEPISGAPRGGPFSIIVINDYPASNSPESILASNLKNARDTIQNFEETTFTNEAGSTIYKFSGQIDFYNELVPYLEYHSLIKGDITDKLNTHVIKATLTYFNDDAKHQEYSQILDRIVKSLKHSDQK